MGSLEVVSPSSDDDDDIDGENDVEAEVSFNNTYTNKFRRQQRRGMGTNNFSKEILLDRGFRKLYFSLTNCYCVRGIKSVRTVLETKFPRNLLPLSYFFVENLNSLVSNLTHAQGRRSGFKSEGAEKFTV